MVGKMGSFLGPGSVFALKDRENYIFNQLLYAMHHDRDLSEDHNLSQRTDINTINIIAIYYR